MQPCRTPDDVKKLSDIKLLNRALDGVPACRSSINFMQKKDKIMLEVCEGIIPFPLISVFNIFRLYRLLCVI